MVATLHHSPVAVVQHPLPRQWASSTPLMRMITPWTPPTSNPTPMTKTSGATMVPPSLLATHGLPASASSRNSTCPTLPPWLKEPPPPPVTVSMSVTSSPPSRDSLPPSHPLRIAPKNRLVSPSPWVPHPSPSPAPPPSP